jgi:cytochrome c oxidase subunit 2
MRVAHDCPRSAIPASAAVIAALLAAGCSGPLSALAPAGRDAERISGLFAWMAAGAIVIWLGVVALALYAPRATRLKDSGNKLIIGGGVLLPLVVLTPLLAFGLSGIPPMLAPAPPGGVSLEVTGAQWWWRVRYVEPGHPPVELANEIRLPVGRRINVSLESQDVIHSFWIPSLAGKMDMIPGRVNQLPLEPTRTGTFRGACAEFCGTSHARMAMVVEVMEPDAFAAWLAAQRRPALTPGGAAAERGGKVFLSAGCNTCHTVRGTLAVGTAGPDLTHVGSRMSIAAGQLPSSPENFRRWIANTRHLKPDALMPRFDTLPGDSLDALAAYLSGLK